MNWSIILNSLLNQPNTNLCLHLISAEVIHPGIVDLLANVLPKRVDPEVLRRIQNKAPDSVELACANWSPLLRFGNFELSSLMFAFEVFTRMRRVGIRAS